MPEGGRGIPGGGGGGGFSVGMLVKLGGSQVGVLTYEWGMEEEVVVNELVVELEDKYMVLWG